MLVRPGTWTKEQLDTLKNLEAHIRRLEQAIKNIVGSSSGDIDAAIAIHTASTDNTTDAELTAAIAAHTASAQNTTEAELEARLSTYTNRTLVHYLWGVPTPGAEDLAEPEMGPPGERGVDGTAGAVGAQGVDGNPGPPGLDGEEGPIGDMGPPGLDGTPGTAGAAGAQGPSGNEGPPGMDGEEGEMGLQGPPGDRGSDGAAGAAGATGATGADGPPGMDGESYDWELSLPFGPDQPPEFSRQGVFTWVGATASNRHSHVLIKGHLIASLELRDTNSSLVDQGRWRIISAFGGFGIQGVDDAGTINPTALQYSKSPTSAGRIISGTYGNTTDLFYHTFFGPIARQYLMGNSVVALSAGRYVHQVKRAQLTGTMRFSAAGDSRLTVTN